MKTYTARCCPSGGQWAISVPELKGVHTQAKRLGEVEAMARDVIASSLGVPADSFGVAVFVGDPASEGLTGAELVALPASWVASEGARPAPSPNAERLRQAMGWERLPEMTPGQRVKFDEDSRRAEEEAQRFYGQLAASRDDEDAQHEAAVINPALHRGAEQVRKLVDDQRLHIRLSDRSEAPCTCGHQFTADPGQQRVPLAEAYQIWTGREPPPPLTGQERAEFDAKLAATREERHRIYGDADSPENGNPASPGGRRGATT